MSDNANDRLDRLFAAAREARPDTSAVEQHFETRLMARILEKRERSRSWLVWSWRLVPVFSALVIMLGIATIVAENIHSRDMFAAITNGQDDTLVKSYLAGE